MTSKKQGLLQICSSPFSRSLEEVVKSNNYSASWVSGTDSAGSEVGLAVSELPPSS